LIGTTVIIGCGGGGCITARWIGKMCSIPVVTVNIGSQEDVTLDMGDESVTGAKGNRNLAWALASDHRDEITEHMRGYGNVIVTAAL